MDLSNKEISEKLKLSIKTVANRKTMIRTDLKKQMKDKLGIDGKN